MQKCSNFETRVVEAAIMDLVDLAGGSTALIAPRGYPHLGLCVIDSIFSLQSRYDVTERVLRRYCDGVPGLGWTDRFDDRPPLHGVSALLDVLGPLSSDDRCELLNWQCAPGTKARKADVVVKVAECLHRRDLDHPADLLNRANLVALEREFRAISGVGPAAWRYLLNLSGIQRVKPDTMVNRWVNAVLFEAVDRVRAAGLVEEAVINLRQDGEQFSIREIDHLIWRDASGRAVS